MEKNVSYPIGQVAAIHVKLGWAHLEVFGADVPELQVMVAGDELSVKELILQCEDGKLLIEQPQFGLSLNLTVGRWMQVCIRVPEAWRGNFHLGTIAGPILVRQLSAVEGLLDTISGATHADGLQVDSLTLQSVSGALQVTRAGGKKLRFRNVSGATALHETAFEAYKGTAVTGDLQLGVKGPFTALELQGATGAISITLPESPADIAFRSVSGKLTCDEFEQATDAPRLSVTTVTGDVRIRKA